MVKLQSFDIVFNHPQAVFHSGDMLGGNVIMELTEPMKMRNLRITLSGKGYTHWSKTSGAGKNRHTSHYRSDEQYFEPTFILFGNDEGEAEHHPAGSFEYPFSLLLNEELPSSFEGEYGHVRYYAKAVIDKPWKFDHEVKVPFTVIHNLDLNKEPFHIKSPAEVEDETHVKCCCCWSGNVKATLKLERQGYVPGETIKITAEIQNQSNTEVINTRIALKQYMEYYGVCDGFFGASEPKAKTISDIVACIDGQGVAAGNVQVWDKVPLTIPPLPPSRLIGCQCINIAYVIKFYVAVNCGNDLKLACPITVGAIPFHHVMPPATPIPGRSGENTPQPRKAIPPPTYKECFKGEVNIADSSDTEYTRGRLNYAPRYPVYTLPLPSHGPSRQASPSRSRQPSLTSQHSRQPSPSTLQPPLHVPGQGTPDFTAGVQPTDISIGFRDFKEERV